MMQAFKNILTSRLTKASAFTGFIMPLSIAVSFFTTSTVFEYAFQIKTKKYVKINWKDLVIASPTFAVITPIVFNVLDIALSLYFGVDSSSYCLTTVNAITKLLYVLPIVYPTMVFGGILLALWGYL